MNRAAFFGISIIFLVAFCACSPRTANNENADHALSLLRSNLEFLASEELQGREVASFGGYAAGQFIVNQLKKYGIQPYGEDGYFQYFDITSIDYEGSQITLRDDSGTDSMGYLKDYYIYTPGDSAINTPLVYVGYGMIDSANNMDDYAGIDVTGKTVLVLRGVPREYTGSAAAGFTLSKMRTAQKAGAAGCFVLFSDSVMKAGWADEIKRYSKAQIARNNAWNYINTIIPDSNYVKKMTHMPDRTYKDVLQALQDGMYAKGATLPQTVSWHLNINRHILKARNIVGILEGNDPARQNEYVTIGAHYDHDGIRGETVYNGADDNGSGTVAVLECARRLALLNKNQRPVLFYFWDGEEKGLLGSDYYTKNHPSIKDIMVNINLDMIGRGSKDSLIIIGSGKVSSEFFKMVENANKKSANFVFDYTYDNEQHPEHLYRRSDQWSFAKFDIPVVFFTNDDNKDYHTPADDAERINYMKIARVTDLAIEIALQSANLAHKLVIDNANITGTDVNR